jgi:hypothetical protein
MYIYILYDNIPLTHIETAKVVAECPIWDHVASLAAFQETAEEVKSE